NTFRVGHSKTHQKALGVSAKAVVLSFT
ncbi:uncharacterized protein METZ01_LOCUS119103, partial [marine metagenome]